MWIGQVENITSDSVAYVGLLIEFSRISGIMDLNVDLVFEILKRVDGATIVNVECVSSLFFALQQEKIIVGRNYTSYCDFAIFT